MIIKRPLGMTRECGKSQGYLGLPLRDEVVYDKTTGRNVPAMVTVWEPTPDELRKLNEGAYVVLRLFGNVPPPQMLTVGDDYSVDQGEDTPPPPTQDPQA